VKTERDLFRDALQLLCLAVIVVSIILCLHVISDNAHGTTIHWTQENDLPINLSFLRKREPP